MCGPIFTTSQTISFCFNLKTLSKSGTQEFNLARFQHYHPENKSTLFECSRFISSRIAARKCYGHQFPQDFRSRFRFLCVAA